MNYPLISEYIEAIKAAEDNFEELTNLRAVLGDDGQPVMTSGNFAVVFKMEDVETGKFYALKCFTKEQEGRAEAYHQIADALKNVDSPYLVSLRYFDKELFVDTDQTTDTEFPVLLMDWVEGKTLDKYLRDNLDDKYALEMLAYHFSNLAQWLIPQPFAHGDLKPDNILVRENGTLVLVDYDGMYVPAMKSYKARELGSPDFRHPLRTENCFDEHIDDFSFVSILLSLKALSINSHWLEKYGAKDRLLLSERDYLDLTTSALLKDIFPSDDSELNRLIGVLLIALSETNLSSISVSLLCILEPSCEYSYMGISSISEMLTDAWEDDYNEAWQDEYGAYYSKNSKKLLKGASTTHYTIREGTRIIRDEAFKDFMSIVQIDIPKSVTAIGQNVFYGCNNLSRVNLPTGIEYIGNNPFIGCNHLHFISCESKFFHFESGILLSSDKKKVISFLQDDSFGVIPNGVTCIGSDALSKKHLQLIYIPRSVRVIERRAFKDCTDLINVVIPPFTSYIGKYAFSGCKSLKKVYVSGAIKTIEDQAFAWCESLAIVKISDTVEHIGVDVFLGCNSLSMIIIPIGSKRKFEQMLPKQKHLLSEDSDF